MTTRRLASCITACWLLCGCPDPNTYGTPRTLAPGDLQVQASLSGYGGTATGMTHFAATPPSVGIRYGVADRFDVGARFVDLAGLGGDAKFNFLRSRIDMAVDPMVQAYVMPVAALTSSRTIGVTQFHVPLLVGFNFDQDTSLVLTPGFVATVATTAATNNANYAEQIAAATSGVGARLGLGLHIRTGDTFSWQPEVTAWHEFNDVESWVYVFGVGIDLGAQPDYSDLASQ